MAPPKQPPLTDDASTTSQLQPSSGSQPSKGPLLVPSSSEVTSTVSQVPQPQLKGGSSHSAIPGAHHRAPGPPASNTSPVSGATAGLNAIQAVSTPVLPSSGSTVKTRNRRPSGRVNRKTPNSRQDVLPAIPGVDISSVSDSVVRDLGEYIDDEDGCWNLFDANPSQIGIHEDQAFAPLVELFDLIIEAAKKYPGLTDAEVIVKFSSKPRCTGQGERSNASRPDALLELVKTTMIGTSVATLSKSRYFWVDVGALFELRKVDSPKNRYENMEKIAWSANHIFAEDPRRRGLDAFTIEDNKMRIWNFTRAGTVVSHPFDFLQDHKVFVQVLISIAFSTVESLGYNPNIDRIISAVDPQETEIQYCFRVCGRVFYSTGEPLSDYKADVFIGRSTRVVLAYEVTPENPVALQLSWLPPDIPMEHQRLKQIYDRIAELDPDGSLGYRRFFLTVEAAGFNRITRDNIEQDDTTRLFVREEFEAKEFYPGDTKPIGNKAVLQSVSGSARTKATGAVHLTPPVAPDSGLRQSEFLGDIKFFQESRYIHRALYCIAFKEIETPIGEMAILHDFFFALADSVRGLRALHKIGFLHRDISTGNILVFRNKIEEKWVTQIKLSDLEYMRALMDLASSARVKTGTLQFIPMEIQAGWHVFWKDPETVAILESSPVNKDAYLKMLDDMQVDAFDTISVPVPSIAPTGNTSSIAPNVPSTAPNVPNLSSTAPNVSSTAPNAPADPLETNSQDDNIIPFYNALHDLESLFWIGLYFLAYSVPKDSKRSSEEIKLQLWAAYRVFSEHNSMDSPPSDRLACLITDAGLMKLLNTLPDEFKYAAATMRLARKHLQKAFSDLEQRPEFPEPFVDVLDDSVYEGLESLFEKTAIRLKLFNVHVERISHDHIRSVNPLPPVSQGNQSTGSGAGSDTGSGAGSDAGSGAGAAKIRKPRTKRPPPPPSDRQLRSQKGAAGDNNAIPEDNANEG